MKKKYKKIIVKDDILVDRLYRAVVNYIENHGGTALVIGGIALVQESPLKFNYGIMIRITGKKPVFEQEAKKFLEDNK